MGNGVVVGSDDDIEEGIRDAALGGVSDEDKAMAMSDEELLACVNEFNKRLLNRSKGI